jgi:hypothetical protein
VDWLSLLLLVLLLSLLLDWLFSIIAIICDRSFSAAAMMVCSSAVDVSDEDELELVFFDVPEDSSRSESSIDVTLAVDLYLY